MILIILENLLFWALLFMIALAIANGSKGDSQKINFATVIEIWIAILAMTYLPLLMLYVIVKMGGHLVI